MISSPPPRADFTLGSLTPEREAALLACIDQHQQATPGQLAAALATNIPRISEWMDLLADRGQVRRVTQGMKVFWERVVLEIDEALVDPALFPRIRAYLTGRRETAQRIARDLGLPTADVQETCKAMLRSGELLGKAVGATYIYSLDIRGSTRVDPDAALLAPLSPEARFRLELGTALSRPAEHRPPPGVWVDVATLASELKVLPVSVTGWVRHRDLPLRRVVGPRGQPADQVTAAAADAYRTFRRETPGGMRLSPELERVMRAELPPLPPGQRRYPPGVTRAVAEKYGIPVATFRAALARIPVQEPGA